MMTIAGEVTDVGKLVEGGIDAQKEWLDPLAEQLQKLLREAIQENGPPAQKLKDFLNGAWLGHPLHPALSDAPIGAWLTGALLDLAGSRRAADTAISFGVLAALPTAAAGLADWHDLGGRPRRVGLAHALLNGAALACFTASLIARGAGSRPLGVALSTAGLTLATGAAYLGGDLVFPQGVSVDRNAWDPSAADWHVAARTEDLVQGKLTAAEIEVDGAKLPLALLREGEKIYALGGKCSHQGGPLAEGKLVDGQCVECPWHGSRFSLQDGSVQQGPAAYAQPSYEARLRGGKVEVRART